MQKNIPKKNHQDSSICHGNETICIIIKIKHLCCKDFKYKRINLRVNFHFHSSCSPHLQLLLKQTFFYRFLSQLSEVWNFFANFNYLEKIQQKLIEDEMWNKRGAIANCLLVCLFLFAKLMRSRLGGCEVLLTIDCAR